MSTVNSSSSGYLPHVDGLRTIAVFSVFIFHLSPDLLTGGFVGVDIFFVISGYLITDILKNSAERGDLRFREFYIRRIKRLFPAFAVVLILCTVAAYTLLNPLEIMEFARSAIYAITSISNIYFFSTSGYFAPAAETQILLHTWSLSVEEQFYLVWPLLTYLIVTKIPKNFQITVILVLTLICMLACIKVSYLNSNFAFYLTPFRMAEFFIGGILCWFSKNKNPSLINEVMTLSGLTILLASIIIIHAKMVFPGWVVFVPCIATTIIIYFSGNSKLGHWLIGNRVMAYLGRISYPLYLVHWPLILFFKQGMAGELLFSHKILIFFIAIILAAVIYHCIEQPLKQRTNFWNINKTVVDTFVGSVLLFLTFYTQMLYFKGLPGQVSSEITSIVDSIEVEKNLRFSLIKETCQGSITDHCPQRTEKKVVILGDSHGPDAINILLPNYQNYDYSLESVGGCPPLSIDDYDKYIKPSRVNYNRCTKQTYKFTDPEFYHNIDYLVFSNLYSQWYTPELLDNFLSSANIPKHVKILILGNAPFFSKALPELILDSNPTDELEKEISPAILKWTWEHDKNLQKVASQHNAKFISKLDYFCLSGEKICELFYGENNVLLTYDSHHLSFEAARLFGQFLKQSHPTLDDLFRLN